MMKNIQENLKRPVFIMSSERLGSNLLRKILGSHSEIAAPRPIHLISILSELLPYYGSIKEQNNLLALATDAILLTKEVAEWEYEVDPTKNVNDLNDERQLLNTIGKLPLMQRMN